MSVTTKTYKLSKEEKYVVDNDFIYYKNVTDEIMKEYIKDDKAVYFMDTESCPTLPQELVDKYDLTRKEFDKLDVFKLPVKTKEDELKGITDEVIQERIYNCELNKLFRSKQIGAEVYIIMLGVSCSNKVIWFNTFDEYFSFMEELNLFKIHNSKKKVTIKPFDTFVHNLAWEVEFLKYFFKESGFEQLRSYQEKAMDKMMNGDIEYGFNVTENSGIVHNARVQLGRHTEELKTSTRKNAKKVKYDYITEVFFKDSLKITPDSLENISKKFLPDLNPIFIKKGDELMEYNLVRDTKNYVPSDLESFYCYCDIRIMKEWWNGFVVPNYVSEGINPHSISQISFALVLKKSYEDNVLRNKYMEELGLEKMSDREIYEHHFGLDYIANNPMVEQILSDSYKGGHTTASKLYREKSERNEVITGTSMDITSSYPSVMCHTKIGCGKDDAPRVLPCGIPQFYRGKPNLELYNDEGEHYNFHFITIAFDGWSPIVEGNQFGLNVKIRKNVDYSESDTFRKVLNCSYNESSVTNIVDGEAKGSNKKRKNKYVDKERGEFIYKEYGHRKYIITVTYVEYLEWIKDYKFYLYDEDNMLVESEVEFIDTVSFKTDKEPHFEKGLMHFYKMKEDAQRDKNKSLELNAKLIINSFYGKHCSSREREQRFYDFSKDIITFEPVTEENINEWCDGKLWARYYGSSVTSYGRIALRKMVREVADKGRKFQYADTDSIYCDITFEDIEKVCEEKGLQISGVNFKKSLGYYDVEKKFENAKFLAQKKYMILQRGNTKYDVKCCGLSADVRDDIANGISVTGEKVDPKELFSINASFQKYAKRKVKGGAVIVPIIYTLQELLRF